MKTITKILMLGLLLFPMFAFAQKATDEREYEVKVDLEDRTGIFTRVPYKVPIYYDYDDNVIKHGPFKINHKEDLTSLLNEKFIIAYNVSGNYVNGKLNGAFSLERSRTLSRGMDKLKGTLNFVNGVPEGTWTFTVFSTFDGKTESGKLVMLIKDKKLVSLSCDIDDGQDDIDYGQECFTISNNKFSGIHDGKVYKNGINTSEFIRKTGERTKPDENVANLINGFIEGTLSESDLTIKGFGFEKSWPWMSFHYDTIRLFISALSAGHFMSEDQYEIYSSAIREMEDNRGGINPALTLKRINLKSAEEMVSIANTIKTAGKISEYRDQITWYEKGYDEGECYRYYYNTNQIEISKKIYYFADEAKLKFEEAIKIGLEERRLEQERKAEERRVQQRIREIESQKKLIPKICSYLVVNKTSTNISYNQQVEKYFDYTGLDQFWRLDLDKAIKPFCKIVGCQLVNLENQGDTNVAILDITKFNKKGNITYRVPVTIKDGKILVTSISFSNATVVE